MVKRVMALGNPGTGKSTILNTAIGTPEFKLGLSAGSGIMPDRQEVPVGDTLYVDSPGLDDPELREQAAHYVSEELSKGGDIRMVFIIKVDDLRVRTQDQTTMKVVLDSLKEKWYDSNLKFSVIINQLFEAEIKMLESDDAAKKILSFIDSEYQVHHVAFLPLDMASKNKEGALLPFREQILEFLRMCPYVRVQENAGIEIKPESFDGVVNF